MLRTPVFAGVTIQETFYETIQFHSAISACSAVKELFFLQEQKSHGLLPMALRMIEGADRDQDIPKAMGGPGFLPSLAPSLIKVRIDCTL